MLISIKIKIYVQDLSMIYQLKSMPFAILFIESFQFIHFFAITIDCIMKIL